VQNLSAVAADPRFAPNAEAGSESDAKSRSGTIVPSCLISVD
jgi:hypothetical protein